MASLALVKEGGPHRLAAGGGGTSAGSAAAAGLALEVLDRLPSPVLLVDSEARILHASRAATELFRIDGGLRRDGRGRCCAASASATFVLRSKIAEAIASGERRCLTVPRQGRSGLAACIVPLRGGGDEDGRGAAAIFVSDPERPCVVPECLLMELYGLTPAEAQVAIGLSNGQRLEDLAQSKGVSINTVRTHLQQIFAKTEVTRQPDVVRLVVTGPGALPV
jgi:DNA-binding CsgD family transcriptional regulator